METNFNTPFIFYLTLEDDLSNSFKIFHRCFKRLGFILLPVRVDQLQALISSSHQEQVIVMASITNFKEMKLYNEKIRGLLKYILKSKRLTFMQLSSFSRLNDIKSFSLSKNYYFMKYPVDADILSNKIIRYYYLKSETNIKWPGGKRAGLNVLT